MGHVILRLHCIPSVEQILLSTLGPHGRYFTVGIGIGRRAGSENITVANQMSPKLKAPLPKVFSVVGVAAAAVLVGV